LDDNRVAMVGRQTEEFDLIPHRSWSKLREGGTVNAISLSKLGLAVRASEEQPRRVGSVVAGTSWTVAVPPWLGPPGHTPSPRLLFTQERAILSNDDVTIPSQSPMRVRLVR
jgi:hypothetical protein